MFLEQRETILKQGELSPGEHQVFGSRFSFSFQHLDQALIGDIRVIEPLAFARKVTGGNSLEVDQLGFLPGGDQYLAFRIDMLADRVVQKRGRELGNGIADPVAILRGSSDGEPTDGRVR